MDRLENSVRTFLEVAKKTSLSESDRSLIERQLESLSSSRFKGGDQNENLRKLQSLINKPIKVLTRDDRLVGRDLQKIKTNINTLINEQFEEPQGSKVAAPHVRKRQSESAKLKHGLENNVVTSQLKKQKPADSLSTSVREAQQEVTSPDVYEKRGRKRKVVEEGKPEIRSEDFTKGIYKSGSSGIQKRKDYVESETQQVTRLDVIDEALSSVMPKELSGIVVSYNEKELVHDIIRTLENGKEISAEAKEFAKSVEELDLRLYFEGIKDISRILEVFNNVKVLNMPGKIVDKDLKAISKLKELRDLNLVDCWNITDSGIASLKNLYSLQNLDLTGCSGITDNGLASLKKLNSLQSLYLTGCRNITDNGLAFLKKLNSLQSLYLSGCGNITDNGLASIKELNSLKYLNLGLSNITDNGLTSLKELNSLQQLSLASCYNITDNGLASIKELNSLQHLNLSHCSNITDNGLASIKELNSLRYLNLTRCSNITDDGLASLKKRLPLCEIIR